ncbi:piezo-type mechanosensitive ion channel component-like [Bacillus rossius redtenbacheri]|uniref:piezo-type mechanosensitive ion channel component-like n=1 Tax=Bacillus rossius redtenbacheri TaxID=93214 RepID=UPI002FDC946E
MGKLAFVLLRVLLPLTLGVGVYFRRNVMSIVYLLLLTISPFIRLPTLTRTGPTDVFLYVVIAVSLLMVCGHIAFHIVLVTMPPYGHILPDCEMLETVFRHMGFLKLNEVKVITAIRLVAPDMVALVCSVVVYIILHVIILPELGCSKKKTSERYKNFLLFVGKYLSLLLLMTAAAIRPSVPGAVYLLVFLGAMNWWACNQPLGTVFAVFLRSVALIMALHVGCACVVQWQYVQDAVGDPRNFYFRLFGLTVLMTSNCSNIQEDIFVQTDWDYYACPVIHMVTFYVLSVVSCFMLDSRPQKRKPVQQAQAIGSLMINMEEEKRRRSTVGSIAFENVEQMLEHGEPRQSRRPPAESSGLFRTVYFTEVVQAVTQLVMENSYVAASFSMMAWSITHHSWVSFVLLVWVCLAWILPPNQHFNILRSSPLLVGYAHLLLGLHYAYSLDLTEGELPENPASQFNLVQMGFKRLKHFPISHILIKCLYTFSFWIVLKQFTGEREVRRNYERRGSLLESRNKLVQLVGELVVNRMAKYWIWFTGVLWFMMGFRGTQMTIKRLIYMSFFLIYILSFQLFYRFWRRMLYVTWLLIGLYSLLVLILIYTFQFDSFPDFWEKHLGVPPHIQRDIGLRQYSSGHELFVHLLPMVLFIAATVIYLHLYHDRFLAITSPSALRVPRAVRDDLRQNAAKFSKLESPEVQANNINWRGGGAEDSMFPKKTHAGPREGTFKAWLYGCMKTLQHYWPIWKELFWRFAYLYLGKISLLLIGATCIYDVCPSHFLFLVAVMMALLLGRRFHGPAICFVSIGVSLFMMARMIYLVDFFNHSLYNVYCLDSDGYNMFPGVYLNNAEWLGLYKVDEHISFLDLFYFYAGLIAAFLLRACARHRMAFVLTVEQAATGQKVKAPTVMFPKIYRLNADKSLPHFLKFLVNYGFYKFGVEFCLVTIVWLMAVRLDVYAVVYGLWLCIMVYLPRRVLARVWTAFVVFVALIISFQYLMAIGLPYSSCIVYPWSESHIFNIIQEWFHLADVSVPPKSYLLMCDIVVLISACHQRYVFWIEAEENTKPCDGGSNKDIRDKLGDPNYINPIPDFFPISGSWLDSLKRIASQAFLWLSLTAVFFTAVNRVNIFSFGYLGLTFFYLWHGEKLYLLPTRSIMWQWNTCLLGYNLAVMMLKMVLQIVGCMFVRNLMETACWAIELLGISCYTHDSHSEQSVSECPLPDTFAGLWWDMLCFSALIFTRRFFISGYFLHLVNEIKVMIALSDRGAYLYEKYHEKKAEDRLRKEDEYYERVQRNMERLIQRQKKIQGPKYQKSPWHYGVIRQGNYYMFTTPEEDMLEQEETSEETILSKPTAEDVLTTAFKTGMGKEAVVGDIRQTRKFTEVGTREPEETPEETPEESEGFSLWEYMKFFWALFEGLMVSLTIALYRASRDYLYVSRMLEWTKNTLKANHHFLAGTHDKNGLWKPAKPVEDYLRVVENPVDEKDFKAHIQLDESQSTMVLLLSSMFYVMVSHSQLACFFIICLVQIRSASLMSLPLPLMVFVWGVFFTPRPTRNFWVVLLAYTKAMIVVKCIFQFRFIPLEPPLENDHPFELAGIIGMERSMNYVTYELVLLLTVYFHRLIQKSMGLWEKHHDVPSSNQSHKSQFRVMESEMMHSLVVPTDVYTYMFFCSFINFVVLLIGFVSFGMDEPGGSVILIFEHNRIPMPLLVLLLIQFFCIIIDRCIYLQRARRARIIMHFIQVVLTHFWLFFVLPAVSQRPFNYSVYPQIFYMVIATYFLFSAYQIRCGSPLTISGNVICGGYSLTNYALFKAYINVPFLFEIRGVMDWMFTTTSMTLYNFLTMESIYNHVFELQCYSVMEQRYGYPSGTKVRSRYKWWLGGLILAIIFTIIWFPLIIFAIGMAVGNPNPPYSMTMQVDATGYASLYEAHSQNTQIYKLTPKMWKNMTRLYQQDRRASLFLKNYEYTDVSVIYLDANSSSVWEATPVDKQIFERAVMNTTEPITFTLTWRVFRPSKDSSHTGMSSGYRKWTLSGDSPERAVLSDVLRYNSSKGFTMPKMLPKFLEVTNQDTAKPIPYLIPGASGNREDAFRDVNLQLYMDNLTRQDWWEMLEQDCDAPSPALLGELPHFQPHCQNNYLYTFNERMMPLTLTRLVSGQGIIALYFTFVYVIGLFIRSIAFVPVNNIMFQEIPYVQPLLQLCLNVYLAREYSDLNLEEYLFSQVLFLFRSPETFIKWMQPPQSEDGSDATSAT